MKGRSWMFLIGIVLFSGVAAGALWIRDRAATGEAGRGIVAASGRIEIRDVRIAAGAAGRVLRLAVQEGDAVTPGQVIAELDRRLSDAAAEGSIAAVEAATANVAAADLRIAALGSQIEHVCHSATELLDTREDLGDVPLIVISSDSAHEHRLAADLALARRSRRGRHVIASGSGHWVPLDAPQAVIDAVVDIVQRGRRQA